MAGGLVAKWPVARWLGREVWWLGGWAWWLYVVARWLWARELVAGR